MAMDMQQAAKRYITNLVSQPATLKALLLDHETLRIVSLLQTQSQLLASDVILVDKLTNAPDIPLPTVTALVFVRPTAENIHALRLELQNPHYPAYKLFFTNVLRRAQVEEIADADAHERVLDIREVFADYYVVSSSLLSFSVLPCLHVARPAAPTMHSPHIDRTVDAAAAIALSLRCTPSIRFQASSDLCKNLAQRLAVRMDQERELFDPPRGKAPPLFLVLDRREDPVTPLLNQWTYEAMIHELIGIQFNRISLQNAPNVPDEYRDLVIDDDDDQFFRANRYQNFGELGSNLQKLVDSFQRKTNSSNSLTTIDDMLKFVTDFPDFRRSSSNVAKHVALAGELSRLVGAMNLLEVSQLEQDLACREAETEHRAQVMDFIRRANVTQSDKLRLVMLYALRYEGTNDKGLPAMKDALLRAGVGSDGIQLITAVKEYAGVSKRSSDVFSNRSFFAKASNTVRRGIGGVDNVYTQHEPLLVETLDNLFRSKLRHADFPLARQDSLGYGPAGAGAGGDDLGTFTAPRELVVLIAGGTTYEEAKCVSAINGDRDAFDPPEGSITAAAAAAARQLNARVVLAGTCVHNSTSFAVEITRNANEQRVEHFAKPFQ